MKLFNRQFGHGPAVMILHGLFGSSDNWQTFGKNLAEEGYRVIMVDLRNHGQSAHDPELNYECLSQDVKELIVAEIPGDLTVIGHSLGGKTAMKLAYSIPEKISGLVVIDIAPRSYPVQHRTILDALNSVDFAVAKTRGDVEEVLKKEIKETAVLQFLMKNLFWKDKEILDWRFNLKAITEQIEEVGKPTYPESKYHGKTLFVKGEKSPYITYDDEREIYEYFSNVEVKTAPEAGHWVHAENPQWLKTELLNFLKR